MVMHRRTLAWSVVFLLFGVSYLLLRISLLRHQVICIDELEHLHAAWCLAHGQVIYRDFFEHHGLPWYLLLQVIPRSFDDPFQALWAGRALMMAFWAGILLLQWRLAEPEWPTFFRAIAVVLLCSFTTFSVKATDIRPDVPNALIASLILVLGFKPLTPWRCFAIGLCTGTGLLFSPKIAFSISGYLAGLIYLHRKANPPGIRGWVHFLWPMLLGFILPCLAVLVYLLIHGSLKKFYEWFWLFNLHFKAMRSRQQYFLDSLCENAFLWAAAVAGWFSLKKNLPMKLACVTTLTGVTLSPHVFRQNYLYVGPLLAFFATGFSYRVSRLSVWSGHPLKRGGLWVLLGFLLVPPFRWQVRSLRDNNDKQLARIRCLQLVTGPNDKILDFHTGESFWRPHAYYYWWMPVEHLQMLSPAIVEGGVLQSLAAPDCRGVVMDEEYFADHPAVLSYVRSHYHDSGCGQLYLRNSDAS